MIAELKSYRGVSCFRCGEPFPVSAKVMSLQDEIELGGVNVPHAFVARCHRCESETVYTIGEVLRFEGEPTRRNLKRARAA